jgi:hypothetical protein
MHLNSYALFQDLISGSSVMQDAGQGKKKGAGRARPLKRVKVAGTAPATEEKNVLKTPVKGSIF